MSSVNTQKDGSKGIHGINKWVRILLLGAISPTLGLIGIPMQLLLLYLYRDVSKMDAEAPLEVQEQLLRLPQDGEATNLLRKLEQVRTDVLHALNAVEGVPRSRESFAARLKRVNKQGKLPDKILRQILVLSRYRNRAVYESYHLQSDELVAANKAFEEIGEWTRKVGYVY